jgi:DNA-binding transcriptional MerR regulator
MILADIPGRDPAPDPADAARAKPKKAPNAFRTISEVADELHIPQHVLRFWETKFPQVKPLKRGGGRRYYRPDDIALLRRISDLLYIQGYTIKGVQRLLREGGGKLSDDIPPATEAERAAAAAERAHQDEGAAPLLPIPGVAPLTTGSRHVRPDPAAAEIARLRALLRHTLEELEAIRRLLRR